VNATGVNSASKSDKRDTEMDAGYLNMRTELAWEFRLALDPESGEDVELPAELIGKLIAPLELLLWNAIDHGIESPAVRAEAGKSADGVITLSLTLDHDRSLGVITVSDDGAGIDEDAVREEALHSGYVNSSQEAKQAALAEMIFHPGLSTSLVVSPVSGRGMGLDVVNTAVGRLGGHVQVQTTRGQGARFTLSVPL